MSSYLLKVAVLRIRILAVSKLITHEVPVEQKREYIPEGGEKVGEKPLYCCDSPDPDLTEIV